MNNEEIIKQRLERNFWTTLFSLSLIIILFSVVFLHLDVFPLDKGCLFAGLIVGIISFIGMMTNFSEVGKK